MQSRLYRGFPGYDVLREIEQVAFIEELPSGTPSGDSSQGVIVVGETLKGEFNKLLEAVTPGDLYNLVGGFDKTITCVPEYVDALTEPTHGYAEGNLMLAISRLKFSKLVVVRADVSIEDSATNDKVLFTFTRALPSTTASAGGSASTSLPLTNGTNFDKEYFNGDLVAISADNPIYVKVGTQRVKAIAYTAGSGSAGTLTLDTAITWSNGATVTRLAAYTIPAGTLVEGENDDGDTVKAATMDDYTFTESGLTVTGYCRPLTENICGKGFGQGSYTGALSDILTATVSSRTCPQTTVKPTGDKSYPYPVGMTMGALAVSHDDFTCESWVNICNTAYANAIGTKANPGGAYSIDAVSKKCTIIVACRHSCGNESDLDECSAIRTALRTHCYDMESDGLFRETCVRPPLYTDRTTALSAVDPGVGYSRHDRRDFCFPGMMRIIPELGITPIAVGSDMLLASVKSQLLPEVQVSTYHGLGEGRGYTEVQQIKTSPSTALRNLGPDDYKAFKAAGICAPVFDEDQGLTFHSGVTTSLTEGEQYQNVRSFKDYVYRTVARIQKPYKGQNPTPKRVANLKAQLDSFLSGLITSERAESYSLDVTTGNDQQTGNMRLYIIKFQIKMFAPMDTFVNYVQIGETVEITLQAA